MVSQDIFQAILAMDSYNRGYGQGILLDAGDSLTGQNEVGRQIGTATVISSDISQNAQSDSFYAVAYDWNGEKIISFRGTDNWSLGLSGDALNSFWQHIGVEFSTQSIMALEFFNSIVGEGNDPRNSGIALTGHSLGGGLAGYVAALHGLDATVFDHMGYEPAAYAASINPLMEDLIYGDFTPWSNDLSGISEKFVVGEALSLLRLGGSVSDVEDIQSHGGFRNPFNLHSQALLVTLMWTEDEGLSDWQELGKELWDAYFNDSVGDGAINDEIGGTDSNGGKMRSTIAYSVIDEGTRVFGDTGVRAMFDDAEEYGRILGLANVSTDLVRSKAALAQAIVHYAGKLAGGKVLSSVDPDALDGILTVAADDSTLTVDFSDALWLKGTGTTDPVGRYELISSALSEIELEIVDGDPGLGIDPTLSIHSDLVTGIRHIYGPGNPSEVIDRIVYLTTNDPFNGSAPEPMAGAPSDSATLFVSADSADTITGHSGNDIVHGGLGGDDIRGGDGDDLLAGGDGDDTLAGDGGNDFIAGGAGIDTLIYGPTGSDGVFATISEISPANDDERSTFEITVDLDGGGVDTDRAIDIERIALSDQADTLVVTDLGPRFELLDPSSWFYQTALSKLEIDFKGSPTEFGADMLDLSAVTAGVRVDLADPEDQQVDYIFDPSNIDLPDGGLIRLDVLELRLVSEIIDITPPELTVRNANSVRGTDYDDILIGQGAGSDGEGFSVLYGGAGDDFLVGKGGESHLYGESGADIFGIGANTTIEDATTSDTVTIGGIAIHGGVRRADANCSRGKRPPSPARRHPIRNSSREARSGRGHCPRTSENRRSRRGYRLRGRGRSPFPRGSGRAWLRLRRASCRSGA